MKYKILGSLLVIVILIIVAVLLSGQSDSETVNSELQFEQQ